MHGGCAHSASAPPECQAPGQRHSAGTSAMPENHSLTRYRTPRQASHCVKAGERCPAEDVLRPPLGHATQPRSQCQVCVCSCAVGLCGPRDPCPPSGCRGSRLPAVVGVQVSIEPDPPAVPTVAQSCGSMTLSPHTLQRGGMRPGTARKVLRFSMPICLRGSSVFFLEDGGGGRCRVCPGGFFGCIVCFCGLDRAEKSNNSGQKIRKSGS